MMNDSADAPIILLGGHTWKLLEKMHQGAFRYQCAQCAAYCWDPRAVDKAPGRPECPDTPLYLATQQRKRLVFGVDPAPQVPFLTKGGKVRKRR